MQVQKGTPEIQNRAGETNHRSFHGSPQDMESLPAGYRGFTDMAGCSEGTGSIQKRFLVPFHQRRMSASKTRSMGVQNLPFFRGIAGSSRDHERGTPRLDNHLAVGKRDRGPESESLGSSVRGILLRHVT